MPPERAGASAEQLLGPSGPLPQHLTGYEQRGGQLQMARAVERALSHGEVLVCEAGTGTGKTLAYLVPAILSGKKVVVSTATRALQEQIFSNDLPLIQRALGLDPQAALMKGLGNYVCRRRYREFARSPAVDHHAAALREVSEWLGRTAVGDIAEAAALSEDDPIWPEVVASSETRIGATCPHYDECFVTRMRRRAEAARLVVVNHHLFFADLALRGPHPGRVLPQYDAVIFDEAHQLEDIATSFFGVRVSRGRVERTAVDAERALRAAAAFCPGSAESAAVRGVTALRRAATTLWIQLGQAVEGAEGRVTLEPEVWAGQLEQAWYGLDSAVEALLGLVQAERARVGAPAAVSGATQTLGAVRDALDVTERRLEQLREQLALIVEGRPGLVAWFDGSGQRIMLGASPVDLSPMFRERVFESVGAAVLTSATLATAASGRRHDTDAGTDEGGPFAFLRSRLGLEASPASVGVTELVVPSPFDFERCALLYVPRDLPPPGSDEFREAATGCAAELIRLTGGGAFVLTTSVRSMRQLARGLRQRLPGLVVLMQGQAPKPALLDQFRVAGDAVLVATMSFWEGVDVPGRSLRLVVLEKIPFPVPADPIVRARSIALEEAGRSPFVELHVPSAAITLKQGFGRLIRSSRDRGIVALLDARLHRRGYGPRLLAALPPARRAVDLGRARQFWEACERVG